MFSLSIFAFILPCLMVLALFIIWNEEKIINSTMVFWSIITIAIIIFVGALTVDCISGEKITETSIRINKSDTSAKNIIMNFTDDEGTNYWGLGSISPLHYSGSVEVPVRITYSPNMRYILKIEKDVSEVTRFLSQYGLSDGNITYREIYSNNSAWGLGCLVNLIWIFSIFIGSISKQDNPKQRKKK